jgi:hypothetical protein
MVPPLVADRSRLVDAKVSKYRERIWRSQTTLTVRKAVFQASQDADVTRPVARALRAYGRKRIEAIRAKRA